MEPVAIFLLLIVLTIIILFVTHPLFERHHTEKTEDTHDLSSLLADRERFITALQELDFDQSLGKIPAEDYPAQRAELLQKGSEVLRQMDVLTQRTVKEQNIIVQDISHISNTSRVSDDDLEDLLTKRRNSRKEKTAGFCPRCGKPVLQSDIFCPSCGNMLK